MAETRSSGSQIYLKVQPGRGLSEGSRNHSQYKGSSHQRNSQRRHLGFHHCGPGVLGRRHLSDRGSAFSRPLLFAAQHGQLLGTCTATATASRWVATSPQTSEPWLLCPGSSWSSRKRWEHKKMIVGKAKMQEEAPVRHLCPRFEDTHSTLPPASGPRGAMASQISPW